MPTNEQEKKPMSNAEDKPSVPMAMLLEIFEARGPKATTFQIEQLELIAARYGFQVKE